MLKPEFLSQLKIAKNLLGFSGGPDSVALFYVLVENEICFDLAIVDYGLRESSKDEVAYARELAAQYQKECFVFEAPQILSNFEARAREIRYGFFEKLVCENGYKNLVLAHQLNDRFEWFLMQLTKGSSLGTLLGFEGIEFRDNYRIIRPFIHTPKSLIYEYCRSYRFYEDSSNQDMLYKRNEFRLKYSNDLIDKYCLGIRRSFEYLAKEKSFLYSDIEVFYLGEIVFFQRQCELLDIHWVDKILKKMGYVLSSLQRQEVLKTDFSLEIGRRYIIARNQKYIFVSKLHNSSVKMPKKFKNIARTLKVPPKIRTQIYFYLLAKGLEIDAMEAYLIQKIGKCE